jgi:hypothetical protein
LLLTRALTVVGLGLLCAACPGPLPCAAPVAVWGDAQKAPELSILARNEDGTTAELTQEGQPVELTFPIQGGHVLFIGARIRNLGACGNELSASLRNPTTGDILATEKRSVDFVQGGPDGGTPDLSDTSSLANVPACPDTTARDVADTDWLLEVKVTDKQQRTATASRHVVPRCQQRDPDARAQCLCECRANYVFGRCGHSDGGADGG